MRPWAGYVRVSHVGGRAGDRFHSPDEQAEAIERWAAARREPVEMLKPELDESGGRMDRPVLMQAVEGVERGAYRGLVVAYLSRASRSVRHLLELWERVERAGGEIVAVAENIDTSTPSGRLTRTMLAAIAEHELDLHRERFSVLRATATASGVWQRRQTPRGYRRDPGTRHLVPDERADEVRAAFRARAAGEPILHIAEALRMTPSGTRQLLLNRVYLGELRVGEHVNPDAHPALIDAELFEAASIVSPRPPRSSGPPGLLAGLVRCAGCGHRMSRSGTKRLRAYTCPAAHSERRCPHPAAVTERLLDAHVERIALAELQRLSVSESPGEAVGVARTRLSRARNELAAYLGAVSAADVGADAFAAGARIRREDVEVCERRLRAELSRAPALPVLGTGSDAWASLEPRERNAVLHGLLAAVVVQRAGGRGSRISLESRVRVLAHDAQISLLPRRYGTAAGISPIELPSPNAPGVLGHS